MLPGSAVEALLAQSRELMVVSDALGRIHWANPAFVSLSGWTDCVGAALPPALGPDPQQPDPDEAFAPWLVAAMAQGRLENAVVRLRRPAARVEDDDADPLYLGLRITALGDELLWNMLDLRAERRAEQQARRVEELLDTAQEFGRIGVWERDIRSGRGHWDRHVFRFWGLDPADGTPSFEAAEAQVHPDDRLPVALTSRQQQPGRYSKRFRLTQADGEYRWIHSQWEIKAGPDGQAARAIGVMMDDTEVVAMARSLDDATAQLTLAVDLAQIAIWRHDLRSNRMHYNPRGFEVIGLPYRPEGMSIDEVRDLIHPDDLPGVLQAAQRAMTASAPTDMEARYLRSDGHWRHVLTRRVLQRDAQGQPLAFIGVALDMTDRVEQQRQAATLARHLDLATQAAGIGVWSRDDLTGVAQWNPEMFRLMGRPPALGAPGRQEWVGKLVHPDDAEMVDSAFTRMMASPEGVMEHEFRIRRGDGEVRWMATRARREVWSGQAMAFGATLDITERRLAAQALQQANERILLATQGAGIGTWDENLLTGEVRWDEQMYSLRGLPPSLAAETPRKLRLKLIHPDDLPQLLATVQRAIAQGGMSSSEYRVRWPDGSYHWLAARAVATCDAAGQALRLIGVNWNIDERVAAEAVRREALAAQRQSEAKSQFLARMSHELRTPLNAILGFTQLLELEQQEAATTSPGRSAPEAPLPGRPTKLAHIRQASEQLLGLVNEVLDLSSLEAGEVPTMAQPVALDSLVADVLQQLGATARQQQVRLSSRPSQLTVLADPQRLRQVLLKLAGHRLRGLPAGSWLRLDALAVAGSTALPGAGVQISLTDNGPRLNAVQQLHLFEPFNRLADAAGQGDPGVRLALVKALLASMGGRIEVNCPDAVGNQFVLSLPGPTQPAPDTVPVPGPAGTAAASPPAPATPTAAGGRVLYIEDNPVNVILVQELIAQRGGLELLCEPTGEEGVQRAIAWQPALVLIDMQLPDFDGFEVLRRLRGHAATTGCRCIALSANAMPEDIARARATGFDDYWTKPIRFNSFLAGLDAVFGPVTTPPGPGLRQPGG